MEYELCLLHVFWQVEEEISPLKITGCNPQVWSKLLGTATESSWGLEGEPPWDTEIPVSATHTHMVITFNRILTDLIAMIRQSNSNDKNIRSF